VGAHVAQQLAAERAREDPADIDDSQSVEWWHSRSPVPSEVEGLVPSEAEGNGVVSLVPDVPLLSESPTVLPIHRKILTFSFVGWVFDLEQHQTDDGGVGWRDSTTIRRITRRWECLMDVSRSSLERAKGSDAR
jgi:hypothetical protein